jgi:hypothetical protein
MEEGDEKDSSIVLGFQKANVTILKNENEGPGAFGDADCELETIVVGRNGGVLARSGGAQERSSGE